MKWSWRIGTVSGIEVNIHATFLILVVFVAVMHLLGEQSAVAAVNAVVFLLALFGCIFFHELGHALAASQFGIKTKDITLLPIGGLARLERMPEKPLQELWVALAGPLVNVVIAIILFFFLLASGGLIPFSDLGVVEGSMIERIMVANVFLVLFNLIPAFPMDGGRILRALLASWLDYTQATQIAAGIGQGIAFLFGFLGLFGNPVLLFIALFVWIGASQESSMVQLKTSLAGIPVARAMLTEFHVLSPDDPLAKAVDFTLKSAQQDFPVISAGKVVGILTQADLVRGLQASGPETRAGTVMNKEFQIVDASEMLEGAFVRLNECQCHTIPALRGGELVGLLTMNNLGEFLLLQSAMKRNQRL